MTELERALASVELDWPATPAFDLRRPARRRRPLLAAVGAVAVAVAVAFAVPPARSAILDFLHLRGVAVERVGTLPAAEERSLAASLGPPIGEREAALLLGRPFRFPAGVHGRLHRSGDAVSMLLAAPDPVLLSELRPGVTGGIVLKKVVGASTAAEPLTVEGSPGVWIGGRHVFELPPSSPRLAGPVLLWERGSVLYRLEGKRLTLARARAIASRIAG